LLPPIVLVLLVACPTDAPEPEPDPEVCDDGADNDGDGASDCDDPDCAGHEACAPDDQPPSAPTVSVAPSSPRTADDLLCSWQEDAVDPEGAVVTYAQRWRLDGQPHDQQGAEISSELTAKGQVWTCVVEASDPQGGATEGTASVAIGNTPPEPIEVAIQPSDPGPGDMLICELTQAPVDPDDEQVFVAFTWLRDGEVTGFQWDFVPSPATWQGEEWSCRAVPGDGIDEGPEAVATVEVAEAIEPHLAAGDHHTCLLGSDGSASCWGSDASGQLQVPEGSWAGLAAGPGVSCGLRLDDGALDCWGDLAGGSPPEGLYADAALGPSLGCGLDRDLDLVGWGDAAGWETPAGGLPVQVAAGDGWCCSLDESGEARCWGAPPFPDPAGEWRRLDAGGGFLCGLGWGGEIGCWGDDAHGQVGAAPPGVYSGLSAGLGHACALQDGSGLVTCWGDDGAGQASPPGDAFEHLAAGDRHTCGLRADGQVVCWGCGGGDPGPCEPALLR